MKTAFCPGSFKLRGQHPGHSQLPVTANCISPSCWGWRPRRWVTRHVLMGSKEELHVQLGVAGDPDLPHPPSRWDLLGCKAVGGRPCLGRRSWGTGATGRMTNVLGLSLTDLIETLFSVKWVWQQHLSLLMMLALRWQAKISCVCVIDNPSGLHPS